MTSKIKNFFFSKPGPNTLLYSFSLHTVEKEQLVVFFFNYLTTLCITMWGRSDLILLICLAFCFKNFKACPILSKKHEIYLFARSRMMLFLIGLVAFLFFHIKLVHIFAQVHSSYQTAHEKNKIMPIWCVSIWGKRTPNRTGSGKRKPIFSFGRPS